MKGIVISCAVAALVLGAAAPASADLKAKKKMVLASAAGFTIEMTEYVKGKRTRTETTTGGRLTVMLQQCDLGRVVQLNDAAKTYFVMQTGSEGAPAPAASGATRHGGVVTVTTTITDTGERKQIQGMAARHVKTTIVQEPGPGACDQSKLRTETDGWYADLDGYGDGCGAAMTTSAYAMGEGGCTDETRAKTVGTGKLGYPLVLTVSTGDASTAITFEIVEVAETPLDAALFEIPAGYREVHSISELMSGQ